MLLIGLTGGIACGKSTVAKIFKDLGAKVIDADLIAKEIVKPGNIAYNEIVSYFGEDILQENKEIDRKKLGDLVFNNEEKRKVLNSITHPKIAKIISDNILKFLEENEKIIFIEAALLIEEKKTDFFNKLIVVISSEEKQIERLIKRDNLTYEEAIARIRSQMPLSEKIKKADYVIDNSGDFEQTKKITEEVWYKLNKDRSKK